MTLTIDLPPALEEKLQQESAREGLPAEVYARKVLEERLLPSVAGPSSETAVNGQRLQAFRDWIGSHAGHSSPPLSDEAISRAEIYQEREDRQL
ncbi:MAG: hypothetical protein QOJ02_1086 [Acidobacteriota bacterium]|nr:hypothetical protein [Acidobacteriota bacterium]